MEKIEKEDFWNFTKEFGKVRRFYRLICKLWQNFFWILRFLLKRHDLLANEKNINPESWNDVIRIWRNSYERAFGVWVSRYMYDESMGYYKNREEAYDFYYNQLSQKSLRFLIDLLSTMQLEDTVYRELFNMWAFEFQFQMNAKFNPDQQNIHVMYCNYFKDDLQYFNLQKEVTKMMSQRLPGKFDKGKMTPKYHQTLGDVRQKVYAKMRLQSEYDVINEKRKKLKEVIKILKEEEKKEKE
jgi:hypothetical protein